MAVINLPEDVSGFGPMIGAATEEIRAAKERKKQQAGLLLNMLMQYGGTIPEEQMTGMERGLGFRRGPIMENIMGEIGLGQPQGSILRNIAQPTFPTTTTPTPEGVTVAPGPQMFKFPSAIEKAGAVKEAEMKAEQPFALEKIEATGREQRKGIETRMENIFEQIKTKIEAQDKINVARTNEMVAKRESTETIAREKDRAAYEKALMIQQFNTQKAILQMQLKASGQKVQTFEILDDNPQSSSFGQPIVAAINDNGQLVKVGISGKAAEKQMTEEQKKNAFEGDMVRMGYMTMDKAGVTKWNKLDENQFNTVKDIASKYGYGIEAVDYAGFWGNYKIPKINMQVGVGKRKVTTPTAPTVPTGKKPQAKDFFKIK